MDPLTSHVAHTPITGQPFSAAPRNQGIADARIRGKLAVCRIDMAIWILQILRSVNPSKMPFQATREKRSRKLSGRSFSSLV